MSSEWNTLDTQTPPPSGQTREVCFYVFRSLFYGVSVNPLPNLPPRGKRQDTSRPDIAHIYYIACPLLAAYSGVGHVFDEIGYAGVVEVSFAVVDQRADHLLDKACYREWDADFLACEESILEVLLV